VQSALPTPGLLAPPSPSPPGWDGARCGQLLHPSISAAAGTLGSRRPAVGPGEARFGRSTALHGASAALQSRRGCLGAVLGRSERPQAGTAALAAGHVPARVRRMQRGASLAWLGGGRRQSPGWIQGWEGSPRPCWLRYTALRLWLPSRFSWLNPVGNQLRPRGWRRRVLLLRVHLTQLCLSFPAGTVVS